MSLLMFQVGAALLCGFLTARLAPYAKASVTVGCSGGLGEPLLNTVEYCCRLVRRFSAVS